MKSWLLLGRKRDLKCQLAVIAEEVREIQTLAWIALSEEIFNVKFKIFWIFLLSSYSSNKLTHSVRVSEKNVWKRQNEGTSFCEASEWGFFTVTLSMNKAKGFVHVSFVLP